MTNDATIHQPSASENAQDKWFDNIIATLKGHQVQLETNTANPEITNVYNTLINGNFEELIALNRKNAQRYFMSNIIFEYSHSIKNAAINQLGFDHNEFTVYVWVEINEDDEATEELLLNTEGIINAKYYKHGFSVNATIVEDTDNYEMPPNYQTFIEDK